MFRNAGFVGVVFLALLLPLECQAQVLYGSVVGTVKDPSDAAVPGATVTITHQATNQSREAITNDVGNFSFPTLQSGRYTIKVNLAGFKEFTETNVAVTLNSVMRVDVRLEVGSVTETVTVSAQAATLQTDRAEVKAELPTKALQDLPVPMGRNYQGLFKTVAGFSLPENAHSIPSNPSRALRFNVNGASGSINNIRVDGVTGTNVWLPHMTSYIPALESIETVNIVTNSFDAEQGLAGGAAVNVQIKSGTNDLHGSAFEYHSDNALQAKNFFLPKGERVPKNVYNQFGGTLGGPIKKDKLFFFVSYETTMDHQFASRFATVPTPKQKAGNFSESVLPIYDPATGTPDGKNRIPFEGNIIPQSRIDPIVAKVLPLIPGPNIANLPANQFTNNYYGAGSFAFNRHTVDTKVNWNIASNLSLNGRYSVLEYNMKNPEMFGDVLGGQEVSSYGGNPGTGFGDTHSITFGANYIFTPRFIIDGNFGWTKMNTNVEQCCLDENIGLNKLGIPGTNGTRRFEGGWPSLSVSNYATYGLNNNFMPYYRDDPQWQFGANANYISGKHNIRFGFDFSIQHLNHLQPEFYGGSWGAPGGFTFGGGPTALNGGAAPNQFNNFASFLLGLPTTVSRIFVVPDDGFVTRTNAYSLYVRDQWQVTNKLTMSLGLRWEYFPPVMREGRGLERYDINTNKMWVCGIGSVPGDCGVKYSKRLFAPRLGLAYRISDDFVVRAAYGITIDPFNLARPMRANHPIALSHTVNAESFKWVSPLKEGIPLLVAPNLGNGIIDIPSNLDANFLPDEFRRGYIQSWNLTLQQKLFWDFIGQIGYVATRQVRQLGFRDQNYGSIAGGNASKVLAQKFGRQAVTRLVGPIGGSHYDSMQASLDRRFTSGLSLNINYTWSKAIGIAGASNSDDTLPLPNPAYYHLNRGVLGIDRPHILNISGIWELPFGPGRKWANQNKTLGWLVGGWQLNAVFTYQSGTPFTVGSSGSSLNAPAHSQRADQVKAEVAYPKGTGRGQSWFDPFAFAPITEPRFGTSGFNILRGPDWRNLDAGLFREFRLTEQVNLQLRVEAFNFTNTPHFGNPGTNRSNMVLNPDGTIRSLGGYTEITSTRGTGREGIDERQFRFGLRLAF